MTKPSLLQLSVLTLATVPAFAQLPAPTLTQRVAPRAAWTAVTSGGTSSTTVNQRADNPGAASNDKLYVFGGCKGNNTATTLNDLWEFEPVAGTFTQLIPNSNPGSPAHRGRASIAWNFATNRLTVFAGNTRGGAAGTGTATLLQDVWEWDATNGWFDVTPTSGPAPAPRQHAPMTWDPQSGNLIVFGGQTNDATPQTLSAETWAFTSNPIAGQPGTWTDLTTTVTSTPAARTQAYLVTRSDFGDCLLCGGIDNATAAPDQIRFLDVWLWSSGDWTKISDCDVLTNPTGAGTTWPAGVNAGQAVYDPLRQRVVVQGGQGITVAANTTYVYGPSYGGSPSNYTSEFDCLTNSWVIYGNPTTGTTPFNNNDPAIGRISRYSAGFIPATGKVYKACGQNAAGSSSNPTYNVYAYQASPVASAVAYGSGCTGPGGLVTLSSNDLPWTGRTWTATCSNLGPVSLTVTMWGTTTASVPLSLLFPFAPVGCDLLQSNDFLFGPDLPVGGQTTVTLGVPNDPTLAGFALNAQVAELEFDLSFQWIGLYASNGITVTIGAL